MLGIVRDGGDDVEHTAFSLEQKIRIKKASQGVDRERRSSPIPSQ